MPSLSACTMSSFTEISAKRSLGRRTMARNLGVEAHRAAERLPDFLRLASQERELLSLVKSRRAPATLLGLRSGVAADEVFPADDRQPPAGVLRRIADHRFGLSAAGHEFGLLQHPLAHHDDPAVALAQVLLGPVRNGTLAHPGHEVLVHYVRGDPAPRLRLVDRAVPVGDALLSERLHLVWHPVEEPSDAQHVLVVDGHPPFEVAAGEETVRPQAGASDGPQLVRLRLTFENTAVDEPVLELVETDLQMGRRLRPLVTLQHARPVAVQPLEVHGVDRVLLALEPVTGDFREDDLHEAISPSERLPGGHERHRRRPQVSPQQAGLGLHGIRLDTHAVLETSLGIRDLLEGLLQALAGVIPHPAVVVAAQPATLDPSIR